MPGLCRCPDQCLWPSQSLTQCLPRSGIGGFFACTCMPHREGSSFIKCHNSTTKLLRKFSPNWKPGTSGARPSTLSTKPSLYFISSPRLLRWMRVPFCYIDSVTYSTSRLKNISSIQITHDVSSGLLADSQD